MLKRFISLSFVALSFFPLLPAVAAEPTQKAWIGVYRKDTRIHPLFFFSNNRWTTPWPKGMELNQALVKSLADLPKDWTGGASVDSWSLTRSDNNKSVLHAKRASPGQSGCQELWGLETTEQPLGKIKIDDAPMRIDGVVTTGDVQVKGYRMRSLDGEDAKALSAVIRLKLAQDEPGKFSLKDFSCSELKGKAICFFQAKNDRSEWEYEPTDATHIYGWAEMEGKSWRILYEQQSKTTSIQQVGEHVTPLGIVTMGDRTFFVSRSSYYESSGYSLNEWRSGKLSNLAMVGAGGC